MLMLRWKLKTQWILVSTTITAHCGFYYLKNNWHFEKMSATVFHNCRSFHKKIVAIVRVLRYPSSFHNCHKFSGAQLRQPWNTYNRCTFMVKNCDICDCLTFQNVIGLICCQWEHWELSGSGQQTDWPLFLCNEFTFWQSDTITLFIFIYFIVIFLWDEYLDTIDISITW